MRPSLSLGLNMPKKLPDDIREQVLTHVGKAPEGLGIEALFELLRNQISRRSLQRLLAELVNAGKLNIEKKGRSSRYFIPAKAPEIEKEDYVPLSTSGAEVRLAVRRPLTERTPVGYKREFLDKYRPNETGYLTKNTVAHLTRIGRTPDSDRP